MLNGVAAGGGIFSKIQFFGSKFHTFNCVCVPQYFDPEKGDRRNLTCDIYVSRKAEFLEIERPIYQCLANNNLAEKFSFVFLIVIYLLIRIIKQL